MCPVFDCGGSYRERTVKLCGRIIFYFAFLLFQFRRDVEDEKLWISEKMPQATSTDYGNSLFNVHMLKKKNQSLRTEIENHEPRITLVCNNGQKLIEEGHEASEEFRRLIEELRQKYQELKEAVETRENGLTQSEKVQQVSFVFLLQNSATKGSSSCS